MEPSMPCIIRSIMRPRDDCSVSCQERFKQLTWECYGSYHVSARWHLMQSNCDPQNKVKFGSAASTPRPSPQAVTGTVTDAPNEKGKNGLSLGLLILLVSLGGILLASLVVACLA